MPWRRIVLLAMVACLLADYSDPTVPGVFAFTASGLFLDGAVDARTPLLKARPDLPLLPRVPELRLEPAHTEPRPTSHRPVDPFRVASGRPRVAPRPAVRHPVPAAEDRPLPPARRDKEPDA